MHIVIGVITAIAGLIWALVALRREGVSLDSFNPFAWYRRYQWRKKFQAHPALTADNPMDIAAIVLLHTAELKGELTRETRQALLDIFQSTFKIEEKEADELFSATSFRLKDGLFEKHASRFIGERWSSLAAAQAQQIIPLTLKIAALDGAPTPRQSAFVSLLKEKTQPPPGSSW
ncbi:MAG: TerB family tellurite resistance protein [Proteobacteria bacterium]|nr:TerB family tellurite resistance protein [Pseudomonadota bacterium]